MRSLFWPSFLSVLVALPALVHAGGQPSPVVDGEGDAADTFGAGAPLHDIDTVSASVVSGNLEVLITFHTTIAAPSSGAFDTAVGLFEIDIDQNPLTGVDPVQNVFAPPLPFVALGIEFILNFGSEGVQPGEIDVVDAITLVPVGTVPVTFEENAVACSVPLSFLGGDDGQLDFTTVWGSVAQPTDAQDVVGVVTSFDVPFIRGDCNRNGITNIADPIFGLESLMLGGDPSLCQDACDANDDGQVNLADAMYTLGYLFSGGLAPPQPFQPNCDGDPTADDLGCEEYIDCDS